MAATVMIHNGGFAAFFEMNRKAWLKLQYVSGVFGLINKIFISMD